MSKNASAIKKLDKLIEKENDEATIATCQKCGSTDLIMTRSPGKVGYNILHELICRDCGFEGTPIMRKKQ